MVDLPLFFSVLRLKLHDSRRLVSFLFSIYGGSVVGLGLFLQIQTAWVEVIEDFVQIKHNDVF